MNSISKRKFIGWITAWVGLGSHRILRAETYLTQDQAKSILLPGQSLKQQTITLSPDQKKAIAKASGVRVRSDTVLGWRSESGSWLIFDNIVGKHEFIDIAVALNREGSVRGIEILTYRETYGGEIRLPKWRAQFTGKTTDEPVMIDKDINNISGATLSCVHVTDGVRRLLQTHALVLKNL